MYGYTKQNEKSMKTEDLQFLLKHGFMATPMHLEVSTHNGPGYVRHLQMTKSVDLNRPAVTIISDSIKVRSRKTHDVVIVRPITEEVAEASSLYKLSLLAPKVGLALPQAEEVCQLADLFDVSHLKAFGYDSVIAMVDAKKDVDRCVFCLSKHQARAFLDVIDAKLTERLHVHTGYLFALEEKK